jgi:hypothetical protein
VTEPEPSAVSAAGAGEPRNIVLENPQGPVIGDHARVTQIFNSLASGGPLASHIRVEEFRALVEERTREFVGRRFIFDEIDRLLADAGFPSGYIVIRGEPGIGKTALIAELVKRRGWVHHFNVASQGIRSSEDFLLNVCAQLIVRYGLDHTALPPRAGADSGFLLRLLDEASKSANGGEVVLLIDALDEAEPGSGTNRLLLPPRLPYGVFVVATTRPQTEENLYVDRAEDVPLRDDDPGNLADVRAYVESFVSTREELLGARLSGSQIDTDQFADAIVAQSQGNFMYLVYVLRDISDGRLTVASIDEVHQLPAGLRSYYRAHWRTMKATDLERFEKFYEPIVCYLAAAREPASVDQLAQWTGLDARRVREVIGAWLEFLDEVHDPEGTRYRIYHASFRDFLQEEVGLADFHRAIGRFALDKLQL